MSKTGRLKPQSTWVPISRAIATGPGPPAIGISRPAIATQVSLAACAGGSGGGQGRRGPARKGRRTLLAADGSRQACRARIPILQIVMVGAARVAIIGGSVAGLTTALLLRDLGLDVTVYERSAAELEQRGA